ncbi:O-methyltransferase [Peptoniphilus obesi]|uniref:O-methyltransferase n=1 Tax=Peptoniphilus obesi TaxID=1472765 RepID=UPI0004B23F74|nr:O-methyltransferase [Peptoniphilus obesi]
MVDINYEYIDEYIDDLYINKNEKLLAIRNMAEENHIPIIEKATEDFLKFIISIKDPKNILELGTAVGYSAIVMAEAAKNINLINTVDKNENMLKMAKENIDKFSLNQIINLNYMDAYDYLVSDENKYDLIFIDAAKGQYQKYFDEAINLLNDDGIIICDNVLFKGMVANNDLLKRRKRTIVKRLREFIVNIKNDDRYLSSIVPIGDGLMLVRRNNA